MNCEYSFCPSNNDYRNAFDITENGDTITIYVKELEKHTCHTCTFLFENKVMIVGMKDGIIQLWRDKENPTTKYRKRDA